MPNYYKNYTDPFPLTASSFNTELDKIDAMLKVLADAIASSGVEFDPNAITPQGRLSLSSTLAVTTSNVTAATTLYYHRFNGKFISIYNGSNWVLREIPVSLSIAVPATTNTNYDVYAYWTGAALTLELVAWSNNTTRATALTVQDGIYVKSGDTGRRYIGTIRTTGVSGQCEDSDSKRFCWNAYNRVERELYVVDTTNQWSYTSAAWRVANGNTSNIVEMVIGLAEDAVVAQVNAVVFASSGLYFAVGIGVDSTTANSAQVRGALASSIVSAITSKYRGVPGSGYRYLAWLESGCTAGGSIGDNGGTQFQSGMSAAVWS